MFRLTKILERRRVVPTLLLVTIVLLASWMGYANGGYFVGDWALVALYLAALALITSIIGEFRATESRWSTAALGLFAAYATWTLVSILWSPNRGDAWVGIGQTLLYLLAFWLAVSLVSQGASRRWVLAASAIGPAIIAALTLATLLPRAEDLFVGSRLEGTVTYYNGEAAFLLVPFWGAIYLAGSRRVNPILRGVALAGTVLSVDLAVLTHSRGATVALAVSLAVFFLFSGQRLRGFFALAPVVLALLFTFPGLNEVYQASLLDPSPPLEPTPAVIERIEQALPTVWLAAAGAGLYGIIWGIIDQRWRPPRSVTRLIGGVALAGSIAAVIFGAVVMSERVGNPVSWGEQQLEAFKSEPSKSEPSKTDVPEQDQSRYLSSPISERYVLWRVAWQDFTSHPLLGVGTYNYEATYYLLRERWRPTGPRHPHSLPLEVLSERGLVGGILFLGFLISCLGAGLWARFRHLSSEGKAQVGALVAALTYWFVHSSAEWFWQMPAITLPAVVYLAMLVGPGQRVEAPPPGWPLRAVGAGVAVLAIGTIAPLYVADRYLTQSYSSTDPEEALAAVERGQRVNPFDPKLPEQEAKLAIQLGDWERAEGAYRKEIQLNPNLHRPYALLAGAYIDQGDLATALSFYQKALARNPLDVDLNRGLMELWGQVQDQQSLPVRILDERGTALGHLNVTVANSAPEREPSLQGWATLPPDSGVLFVWAIDNIYPFWLKNTTAPLDVAFVESQGGGITEIKSMTYPSEEQIIPTYPTRLAIVANWGFFERNNIRPGNQVVVVSP